MITLALAQTRLLCKGTGLFLECTIRGNTHSSPPQALAWLRQFHHVGEAEHMDCTRCFNSEWCETEGQYVTTSYVHVYRFRWMKLMWSCEPSTHAHILHCEQVFCCVLFVFIQDRVTADQLSRGQVSVAAVKSRSCGYAMLT